jgi:hypothetical protein
VVWSCWELKWKVSRALTRFFGEHCWTNSEAITAYYIPKAVHPFIVPIPIESLLLMLIKDTSLMDCIHQYAVMFPEKQDVEVGMETKYNSISMPEFAEIPLVASLPKETKNCEKIFPPSLTST